MNSVENLADKRDAQLEANLRRKARRQGYKLIKLREGSGWYNSHGPYIVSDLATNAAVLCNMTLPDVRDWLNS